jgi:hypothetical protein
MINNLEPTYLPEGLKLKGLTMTVEQFKFGKFILPIATDSAVFHNTKKYIFKLQK